jgi:hypothetical protein
VERDVRIQWWGLGIVGWNDGGFWRLVGERGGVLVGVVCVMLFEGSWWSVFE